MNLDCFWFAVVFQLVVKQDVWLGFNQGLGKHDFFTDEWKAKLSRVLAEQKVELFELLLIIGLFSVGIPGKIWR